MQKPRIFLTSLCSNVRQQKLIFEALQKESVRKRAAELMFGRYVSELFEFYHLLYSDHDDSLEALSWFGARLQGFLLLVDAEAGFTEEISTQLAFAAKLRLPIAAMVIMSPEEDSDEAWLELVETDSRQALARASFPADSIACLRWREGDTTAPQQLYTIMNAFFSLVVPFDLKPLRVELLSRKKGVNCVLVTGVYWQGSLSDGMACELVGLLPTKRVTLLDASPKNPLPGSVVECRLSGVLFEELFLGQMLCTPESFTLQRRREVWLWKYQTLRSQPPSWLIDVYPGSTTNYPAYVARSAKEKLGGKGSYSVQVGLLDLHAFGEFVPSKLPTLWTGWLEMPVANLSNGELICYPSNERDPLAAFPATEAGSTFLLKRWRSYWGVGVFV